MQQNLDMWIMNNSKFFAPEQIPYIREQMTQLPEQALYAVYALDFKDPMIITLVSALAGSMGVDRFLLGDIGLGVAKLLTAGGCWVWWIIDIFYAANRAREVNFQAFMQAIGPYMQQNPHYPPPPPPQGYGG